MDNNILFTASEKDFVDSLNNYVPTIDRPRRFSTNMRQCWEQMNPGESYDAFVKLHAHKDKPKNKAYRKVQSHINAQKRFDRHQDAYKSMVSKWEEKFPDEVTRLKDEAASKIEKRYAKWLESHPEDVKRLVMEHENQDFLVQEIESRQEEIKHLTKKIADMKLREG